jgi:hypothetical protein
MCRYVEEKIERVLNVRSIVAVLQRMRPRRRAGASTVSGKLATRKVELEVDKAPAKTGGSI